MKRLAVITILLFACLSARAQQDFGIWQYFTISKSFGHGISAILRLEHRSKDRAQELDCALVMPGITYRPVSWFQTGFYYDFAISHNRPSTFAGRHVLLPFIQFQKSFGDCTVSIREMGQYVVTKNFLLRSKLQVSYAFPEHKITPLVAVESYTDNTFARLTAFGGIQYRIGKRSTIEAGYSFYYLASAKPGRHIVNFGYSIRL